MWLKLLEQQTLKFFSVDFVKFAMSPSDSSDSEGKVNGKLLFLMAFRSHLCECKDISSLLYLFTD